MSEHACTKCMWVGKKEDRRKNRCPRCGHKTEYVPYELDWKYHRGAYDWNKK